MESGGGAIDCAERPPGGGPGRATDFCGLPCCVGCWQTCERSCPGPHSLLCSEFMDRWACTLESPVCSLIPGGHCRCSRTHQRSRSFLLYSRSVTAFPLQICGGWRGAHSCTDHAGPAAGVTCAAVLHLRCVVLLPAVGLCRSAASSALGAKLTAHLGLPAAAAITLRSAEQLPLASWAPPTASSSLVQRSHAACGPCTAAPGALWCLQSSWTVACVHFRAVLGLMLSFGDIFFLVFSNGFHLC